MEKCKIVDRLEQHMKWLKEHPEELKKEAALMLHKIGLIEEDCVPDKDYQVKW